VTALFQTLGFHDFSIPCPSSQNLDFSISPFYIRVKAFSISQLFNLLISLFCRGCRFLDFPCLKIRILDFSVQEFSSSLFYDLLISRFLDITISRLLEFTISRFLEFKTSRFHDFRIFLISAFFEFTLSQFVEFLDFRMLSISGFLDSSISRFHPLCISRFHHFSFSRFHDFTIFWISGILDFTLSGPHSNAGPRSHPSVKVINLLHCQKQCIASVSIILYSIRRPRLVTVRMCARLTS